MKENMAQTAILTFTDGRKAKFVGPAVITDEDIAAGVKVCVPVEFSKPWQLPEGASFVDIDTTSVLATKDGSRS